MHFSLASVAFASAALLSLVSAIPQSPAAYYDSSAAPDPDSTNVESTKTDNVANKAECTPRSYSTPRTFVKESQPGPHCSYFFYESPTTDVDRQTGIQQCKNKCTKDPNCRTFGWTTDSTQPDIGICLLDNEFYNPSYVQCDSTKPNTFLAVYNVSNWTPWNPLVSNGDFESGCLKPWFFQDFTSDNSMKKTVIRCNKNTPGDCAPNGGKNYVRITGNGQNGSQRDHIDAYIGQQPALTEGQNYKMSAYVKGDSGSFRFTYPAHLSVVIRADATKNWTYVSNTFTGRSIGTFLIQMDAPAAANFAIDNVQIVPV